MKPKEIFDYLETHLGLNASPVRLKNAIESALVSGFGVPLIKAAELAESREKRVGDLINKKQIECENNGTIFTLCLVGVAADAVAGSCHILASDSPEIVQAKTHRLNTNPLLARIKALTFQEFEVFGSKLLRELGAKKAHVTPQSNDQGIDFYGIVSFGELNGSPSSFFKLFHEVEIRFVGQAKHYPNRSIGTATVRELVGSVDLARFKTYSIDTDPFENINLKPFSPLVTLLITSGTFTSGAIDLASRAGILAKDGEQLATFLADKGVGMIATPTGSSFDLATFDSWLSFP